MMLLTYCHLPLPAQAALRQQTAANTQPWCTQPDTAQWPGNVRLLTRQPERLNCTRFVLSGRLSDVCAALEQMVTQEQLHARRLHAVH